mgnify:CR=1 FL=1
MASKRKFKHKKQTILNDLYLEFDWNCLSVTSYFDACQLGVNWNVFKAVGLFVFGEFFWLIAIAMVVNGGRMIVKRQIPTFFSAKQIGWYLVFISLIVFSHLPVYREFNAHDIALLGGMWNYYFSNDLLNSSFTVGGGLIGAVIYGVLVPLITSIGLYAVAY